MDGGEEFWRETQFFRAPRKLPRCGMPVGWMPEKIVCGAEGEDGVVGVGGDEGEGDELDVVL